MTLQDAIKEADRLYQELSVNLNWLDQLRNVNVKKPGLGFNKFRLKLSDPVEDNRSFHFKKVKKELRNIDLATSIINDENINQYSLFLTEQLSDKYYKSKINELILYIIKNKGFGGKIYNLDSEQMCAIILEKLNLIILEKQEKTNE